MTGKRTITALVTIFFLSAFAFGAEPAKPASLQAGRLQPLLKLIRETKDPGTAMAAYARGCAIDRNSTELHDSYMRKMLTLGLPQIARFPARSLVALDAKNGTAWGVLGYMAGKHGRLGEALTNTIRAAALLGDAPSVLNNLGQLCAWYEHVTDLPRIPDADRRTLAKHKEQWSRREAFAMAYRRIQKEFQRQEQIRLDLDKKIAAAQVEANVAGREVLLLNEQLGQAKANIDGIKDRIDSLRRDRRWAYRYTLGENQIIVTSDGQVYYYPRYNYLYRDELSRRIRQEEQALRSEERRYNRLRRQVRELAKQAARKRNAVDKLRKQSRRAAVRLERTFRWDPPAVDGVVFPEIENLPLATRRVKLPEDPEADAAQQLSLAKLYLAHALNDKAETLLRGILKNYGSTAAAKEVRSLLGEVTTPGRETRR